MKKMFTVLLSVLSILFFTACGGGSDNTNTSPVNPPIKVNLIGTWDYKVAMQNSICDGLLAQGIQIVEGLNGSTTTIGDIILDGTNFNIDSNQKCYLSPINKVDTSVKRTPSIMTKDDFLNWSKQ